MTLFEECLEALGEYCEVLSEEKSNQVVEAMCRLFPVAINGRIDWDN
ncbi:CDI toxin immunity protein [Paludifilum halophilum]